MAEKADVVIAGAGIAGIAAAHALVARGVTDVALVDPRPPLTLTSDKSGANYRDWWPQRPLARLVGRSIELMDALHAEGAGFEMNRRGYLYVSSDPAAPATLPAALEPYASAGAGPIRVRAQAGDPTPRSGADGWNAPVPAGRESSEGRAGADAFDRLPEEPARDPPCPSAYPRAVLLGATRLVPGLRVYVESDALPVEHTCGYYVVTPDDLPLVGPLGVEGAFALAGFAGFGAMAACGAGELAAAWIASDILPAYASDFAPRRFDDAADLAGLAARRPSGAL